MRRSPVIVIVLLAATASAAARTWHVEPDGTGDAPTIKAALDSSAAGDTVEVACGLYHEHEISMKSGAVLRSANGDPACVTIDAEYVGPAIRVWYCDDSVIEGMTIVHGRGFWPVGGGVSCSASTIRISSCVFLDNMSPSVGGGVLFYYGTTGTVEDCLFRNNVQTDAGSGGGGLAAVFSSFATVSRCEFIANQAQGGGGAYFLGSGGLLEACVFAKNRAVGYDLSDGGGAVSTRSSDLQIVGSTFVSNTSVDRGAALYCSESVAPSLVRTILAFNQGGAAVYTYLDATPPTLSCCDVYGNEYGDWVGRIADQATINGNFSVDPLFCGPPGDVWTIRGDSPCAPPGITGCGLVGAGHVACGAVSLPPSSWGRVKEAYRQ